MIVLTILTITISMLSNLFVSSSRMLPVNRESALATNAARDQLERMRNVSFDSVFRSFNTNGADDPGGSGSAPGKYFGVSGLSPKDGSTADMIGEVIFPEQDDQIREDLELPKLNLPRDLSGDGEVDGADHSSDYIVLPVIVRISWSGVSGDRKFELYTMFSDL